MSSTRLQQAKDQLDEEKAILYLNQTLNISVERGHLHTSLKNGIILCKWVWDNQNKKKDDSLSLLLLLLLKSS